MDKGLDRRQHRRAQVHGTVHGTVGLSSNLRIVDLSPAGAMVEHAHDLSPGQPCVLDLRLDGIEVHLRAHVAWCHLYSVGSAPEGGRGGPLSVRPRLHRPPNRSRSPPTNTSPPSICRRLTRPTARHRLHRQLPDRSPLRASRVQNPVVYEPFTHNREACVLWCRSLREQRPHRGLAGAMGRGQAGAAPTISPGTRPGAPRARSARGRCGDARPCGVPQGPRAGRRGRAPGGGRKIAAVVTGGGS